MQVNVRNGKPVVKLTKKEEKALSDASHVLNMLANFADCKDSGTAADAVDLVIKKHASHVEAKSEAPAPSKASA